MQQANTQRQQEQEIQSVVSCLLGASSTKRIGSEREGCNTLQAWVHSV